MILTVPCSRARDLNSSSSPARTVRSLQLALDDGQPFRDVRLVGGGAVAAEQELAHIGRHWILAAELLGEVLPDDVAVECLGGELSNSSNSIGYPPTVVNACNRRDYRR